jgi:tRNA dimethylallyltransferase
MAAGPIRCVCLTGPTACGKTELALELAASMPLEVVSMDSALVYRGMDVGTAKPSAAVRAAVPHHLVDVIEPNEPYSAGRFARDAGGAIEAIAARGRLPLLVGGTLLYLRALRDGLDALPRADPALRACIEAEAATQGWDALHRKLAAVDPDAALRIAPSDRQRIQRALEVHALTSRPITALQRGALTAGATNLEFLVIALVPADRAALAERIERRFDAMVARGFVAEVEKLRARGDLTSDMASMRAVGYRQVWSYLSGEINWEEARRRATAATRQLAKRQMTWLRSERDCERWEPLKPALGALLRARVANFWAGPS